MNNTITYINGMSETSCILIIIAWAILGIYSLIVWWRRDFDIDLFDLIILVIFGSTIGVFFGIVIFLEDFLKLTGIKNHTIIKKKGHGDKNEWC